MGGLTALFSAAEEKLQQQKNIWQLLPIGNGCQIKQIKQAASKFPTVGNLDAVKNLGTLPQTPQGTSPLTH